MTDTPQTLALALSVLNPHPRNSRTHSDDQLAYVERLMREYGWTQPILARRLEDGSWEIVAGHGRKAAASRIYATGDYIDLPGGKPLPFGTGLVLDVTGWTDAQVRAYVIADNRSAELAGWDAEILRVELTELQQGGFDISLTGFADLDSLDDILAGLGGQRRSTRAPVDHGKLAEAFGVPPFSVLNARDGWWADRKRAWLARGIKSELGRGVENGGSHPVNVGQGGLADQLASGKGGRKPRKPKGQGRVGDATSVQSQGALNRLMGNETATTGTSIFDPVLCELAYRWFCPPGGLVLDPFAGGSVRGLVAAWLGRSYLGHDLSGRQLEANRQQAAQLLGDLKRPVWVQGDSRDLEASLQAAGHEDMADMVFTCPPYADLEIYSDDPADLSNMPYEAFLEGYERALAQAAARLRQDRFAVVVVGEVRDPRGHYRNFVGDTVEAMRAAGLEFYNEAILVTPVGSLPVRSGKQFRASRKMGKTHQNVLVFVKGDYRKATRACGEVEFGEVAPDGQDQEADA